MTVNVDQVVLWMVSGLTGDALVNACIGRLSIEQAEAEGLIAEARKRVTLAAEYNRDELLGTALTRLTDLYGRCMAAQTDKFTSPTAALAKALDVQKEINRLAGLHEKPPTGDHGRSGREGEGSELEHIAAYLLPLELADETYPVREHARLAAQRIRELESEQAKGDD